MKYKLLSAVIVAVPLAPMACSGNVDRPPLASPWLDAGPRAAIGDAGADAAAQCLLPMAKAKGSTACVFTGIASLSCDDGPVFGDGFQCPDEDGAPTQPKASACSPIARIEESKMTDYLCFPLVCEYDIADTQCDPMLIPVKCPVSDAGVLPACTPLDDTRFCCPR